MKAVILAGGLGTRLRTIVADRPKPMAEIGGKPFLEYQIEQLRAQRFTDLVLCVGHRASVIQDHFADGRGLGVRITYVVEQELLGTAGALGNARALLDATFLVLNGDSYLDADLRALVDLHLRRRVEEPEIVGTLAAVAMDDVVGYGALALDEQDHVLRFEEKGRSGPGWINAGVYALEPAVLAAIPTGVSVSIERQTFPDILARGKRLVAYRSQGAMVDIGTPAGYAHFGNYAETAFGGRDGLRGGSAC